MKRIWALGIFCILLTVVFVGQNIFIQRQNDLLEARADVDELVHFVAIDMHRNLFGVNQIFLGIHNVLAYASEEPPPNSPQFKQALNRIEDVNPFVRALTVLDASGKIIHWSGKITPPNVRDRNYYTVHEGYDFQGLFISGPMPSKVNEGQWIFASSKAYRRPSGELDHIIVAIIDLEYFHSNYSTLQLAPGEAITITSPLGEVYARIPGHEKMVGKQLPPVAENIGEYTFLRAISPPDGKVHGTSLMRVGDYPLIIAVSYDEELALADWRKNATLISVFGLVVCSILFLLTLLAARFQRQQLLNREMLLQQATTDPLTQLANRRHALECANLEIKKAKRQGLPLSFVIMDLDHFKKINDGYGHETGDQVLQRVAKVLRRFCRQTDVVSRFGGEEFLLILPGTDLSGAEINSEKIRKALENDMHKDFSGIPRVTASFGVAQWTVAEIEFKDTLRRADRALYQAKESGRNCIRIAAGGNLSNS